MLPTGPAGIASARWCDVMALRLNAQGRLRSFFMMGNGQYGSRTVWSSIKEVELRVVLQQEDFYIRPRLSWKRLLAKGADA